MPHESQKKMLREIDQASERMCALCELLAAAQEQKVSAACLHSLLKPIAQQLGRAAGVIADGGLLSLGSNHQP